MKYTDKALKKLREGGLKVTPQRLAVIRFFADSRTHHTPQDIYAALEEAYPSLSVATVYNTLEALERIGVVTRISAENGRTYFDPHVTQHHHAFCENCGAVHDLVDTDGSLELDLSPDLVKGFQITGYHVWVRGLCRECEK